MAIDKKNKIVIGPPRMTRFERARIIGARSLQLSMGAPLLVKVSREMNNPIEIALKELEMKVLPITIRRSLPDNTYQDVPIQWLQLN